MKPSAKTLARVSRAISNAFQSEGRYVDPMRVNDRLIRVLGYADLGLEDLVAECMYAIGVFNETDWTHPKPETRQALRAQLRRIFAA
jgi:hypothetical protein